MEVKKDVGNVKKDVANVRRVHQLQMKGSVDRAPKISVLNR